MKLPSYSVIIPAYNAAEFLEETVISAVLQTHPPLEIIIINDKSTDGTQKVIDKLCEENSNIHTFENVKNLGVAKTRNFGFSRVRGEYTALLDADDQWETDKMEIQLKDMQEKNCDFSYTGYSFINKEGNRLKKIYSVPSSISIKSMLKENYIGCSTVVLKREITANYSMSSKYAHEDYVFWLELLKDNKKACGIDSPLMKYRISPDSRSGNKKKAAKNRWKIYREYLEMGKIKSAYYFSQYAIRGLIKHKF